MTTDLDTAVERPPAGHCDDPAAWAEFVRQYDGQPRSRPDLTDFALANAVFMADRSSFDLIVYQTAAKERIRWLSIELAKSQAALSSANARAKVAEEGLRAIAELCPATCETTTAHDMAQIAVEALATMEKAHD